MNVASSNATPPSVAVNPDAAANGTTARVNPGSDGTDLPTAIGTTLDDTFGRMLSRGLTGLDDGVSAKPPALPLGPGVAIVDDPSADAPADRVDPAKRGRGFGAVVTELVNVEAGVPRPSKAGDDGSDDGLPVDGRHDDTAANDLAAQLALVSQWAGIAKAPASPAAQGVDGLAIKEKLDTVRGAASSTQRTGAPPARLRAGDQPDDGAALSSAVANRSAFGDGDRRVDPGATSTAVAAKADAATARTEGVQATVDLAAGAVRSPADAVVAPTGAFALQIAAATSAIVPQSPGMPLPPTVNIHEPVGTPAWSREVGQATLRIATGDLQGASLQINPEHLGPVDVQVHIDNGVAHLSFAAAHADTRQAIESSRATLDRLFADQGLKIGDCAVGDASTSRRNFDADAAAGQSQRQGGSRWDQPMGRGDAGNDVTTPVTTRLKALGLVDTFA